METENERRAKSLQNTMKEASKKDAELFNLKTFKKNQRKHSTVGQENLNDSMISPRSSAFKSNSRKKGDALSDDEGLSPSNMKFGSLRLFPSKESSSKSQIIKKMNKFFIKIIFFRK